MVCLIDIWISLLLLFVDGASFDCDINPNSVEPQGVHLAYAGHASSSIAVSFFTCGSGGSPHVTIIGGGVFIGATSRYYTRYHHDIVLNGLDAGTAYTYRVSLDGGPQSQQFTFSTAPLELEDVLWKAAVVGDMGVNNSADTIAMMIQRASSYNFTIHLGDISYADDFNIPLHIERSSGHSYEAVYDFFQRVTEPLTAAMPYMVTVGNHEISCCATEDWRCPEQQKNFSAYRYRFRMPSSESLSATLASHTVNTHHNMWYSWRVGSVHFVSLDTETDFPNSPARPNGWQPFTMHGGGFGDQLGWLRKDLSAANEDNSVKWIVAIGHRPWYSSMAVDWPLRTAEHVQKAFEPILYEFKVDLLLLGHKHFYERAVAAYGGRADQAHGIPQIINGGSGSVEGIDKGRGIHGLIAAAEYDHFGYGELAVVNASAMRWQYILAKDGSVVDELVLPSKRQKAPPVEFNMQV